MVAWGVNGLMLSHLHVTISWYKTIIFLLYFTPCSSILPIGSVAAFPHVPAKTIDRKARASFSRPQRSTPSLLSLNHSLICSSKIVCTMENRIFVPSRTSRPSAKGSSVAANHSVARGYPTSFTRRTRKLNALPQSVGLAAPPLMLGPCRAPRLDFRCATAARFTLPFGGFWPSATAK